MKVINEVLPSSKEQLTGMAEEGPAGPIFMVNLLKFKDKAQYADGRETSLTGRQAYDLYAREVVKLIVEFGGSIVFVGNTTFLAIGQVDELWEEVAIASYPSRADLFAMSTSQRWREISVHRTAGLAGQLNIETVGLSSTSESV